MTRPTSGASDTTASCTPTERGTIWVGAMIMASSVVGTRAHALPPHHERAMYAEMEQTGAEPTPTTRSSAVRPKDARCANNPPTVANELADSPSSATSSTRISGIDERTAYVKDEILGQVGIGNHEGATGTPHGAGEHFGELRKTHRIQSANRCCGYQS